MGEIEREISKRRRRKNFQRIVLSVVAGAGVVGVAMVAPNVLGAMKKLGVKFSPRDQESIKRSREGLIKKGLLAYSQGNLTLTKKGESVLRLWELRDFKAEKPARWDRRWRLLIFDIPERRKTLRDKVRRTLQAIGFVKLQDSVWVFPYDCEDLITLLKADFSIGRDVLYLVVEGLEYDTQFRKHFELR